MNTPEKGVVTYIDGLTQEVESHKKDQLPIGNVMLTEAGDCLCRIIQPTPIPNYISLEKKYMISNGVVFKERPGYLILDNGKGQLSLHRTPEPATESNVRLSKGIMCNTNIPKLPASAIDSIP